MVPPKFHHLTAPETKLKILMSADNKFAVLPVAPDMNPHWIVYDVTLGAIANPHQFTTVRAAKAWIDRQPRQSDGEEEQGTEE